MHPDRRIAPKDRITDIGNLNIGDRVETVHFEDGVFYQTMRAGTVVERHQDPPLTTVEFRELRDGKRLRESLGHGTIVVNWGQEVITPSPRQPYGRINRMGIR